MALSLIIGGVVSILGLAGLATAVSHLIPPVALGIAAVSGIGIFALLSNTEEILGVDIDVFDSDIAAKIAFGSIAAVLAWVIYRISVPALQSASWMIVLILGVASLIFLINPALFLGVIEAFFGGES